MNQTLLDKDFGEVVRSALTECGADDTIELFFETSLSELGLDSVGAAELLIVIENEYNIVLKQQEVMDLDTVGELWTMTHRLRSLGKTATS